MCGGVWFGNLPCIFSVVSILYVCAVCGLFVSAGFSLKHIFGNALSFCKINDFIFACHNCTLLSNRQLLCLSLQWINALECLKIRDSRNATQ